MKSLLVIIVFVLTTAISAEAQIDKTVSIQDTQLTLIRETLINLPNHTQFSIGIVSGDKISYVGFKKINNDIIFNDNKDSLFEIGSLTKTFTASILAQLAVEKKIKVQEPINKYLPFKIPVKIPFVQLANHSSGLARLPSNFLFSIKDQQNPYKYYTESDFEEFMKSMELNSVPGKNSEYSNAGYGVLGYTLTKIENKTFEAMIQERICQPNRMKETTSEIKNVQNKLVKGMDATGNIVPNWEWGSSMMSAGGVFSNCTDMVKYLQMNLDKNNDAVQLAKQETIEIDGKMSVGLGWHIIKNKFPYPIYWHNGRTGGYSSSLVFDDEKKTGIVILSNVATDVLDELCFQLLKLQDH